MSFPILKDCSKTVFLNNGNIAVQRFQIITTSCIIYNVYKRDYTDIFSTKYSTFTFLDHKKYGMIGTKRLESKKPVGKERFKFIEKWYSKQFSFAEKCILKAFPELNNLEYRRNRNEIERYAQKGIDF